tara:strand:- start:4853 stop:5413 length:561 start_codon:yes stop_codon:yes gene_type:complete
MEFEDRALFRKRVLVQDSNQLGQIFKRANPTPSKRAIAKDIFEQLNVAPIPKKSSLSDAVFATASALAFAFAVYSVIQMIGAYVVASVVGLPISLAYRAMSRGMYMMVSAPLRLARAIFALSGRDDATQSEVGHVAAAAAEFEDLEEAKRAVRDKAKAKGVSEKAFSEKVRAAQSKLLKLISLKSS